MSSLHLATFQFSTPPKRFSPKYPSDLSNALGPTSLSQVRHPNLPSSSTNSPRLGGAHQYQSLELLLSQAGYAETRVITPEAVRIKERIQRLWAEDAEAEKRERGNKERKEREEVEGLLFQDDPNSPRSQKTTGTLRRNPKDGSFGGWSIGRAQGARILEEGPAGFKRPPRTRGSALGLTFTPDEVPVQRALRQAQPRPRHVPADDCGSLSSASSGTSSDSTMITSPPEISSETFVAVHGHSPPLAARPLVSSDPYRRILSNPNTEDRVGSFPMSERQPVAPQSTAPEPQAVEVVNSAATRSLRKIASQSTLRNQPSFSSTTTRVVRPKRSVANLLRDPPPAIKEESPASTFTKALRHAASTPFLHSAAVTISPASDVKGKAPAGWFATLSRLALARSAAEPAPPPLRPRKSIPFFHLTQPYSVVPSAPIPAKVTKQSVTCMSDEGDDLPPFASTFKSPFSEEEADDDQSDAVVRTPPVLTPRADYGEVEGWKYDSEPSTSQTAKGWDWSATSPLISPPVINISPSSSAASSPPPSSRPLRAQRSIKSLRAALLAHGPSPPVPPLPPNVRLPIFAISSPDTLEQGLPPRSLDLSDEAIARMGKGRWHGSDREDDEEDDVAADHPVGRDADARGRSKKRGSGRKAGRR